MKHSKILHPKVKKALKTHLDTQKRGTIKGNRAQKISVSREGVSTASTGGSQAPNLLPAGPSSSSWLSSSWSRHKPQADIWPKNPAKQSLLTDQLSWAGGRLTVLGVRKSKGIFNLFAQPRSVFNQMPALLCRTNPRTDLNKQLVRGTGFPHRPSSP